MSHGLLRRLRVGPLAVTALALTTGSGALTACGSAEPSTARDDSAAAFVFEDRCATCHRPGGPGKDTATMDLSNAGEVILKGRVDKGMPAFAGVLSSRQVDELAAWLGTQQGVPMPTVATSADGG